MLFNKSIANKFWLFYFSDSDITKHDLFAKNIYKNRFNLGEFKNNADLQSFIKLKEIFKIKRKLCTIYFFFSLFILLSTFLAMVVLQCASVESVIKGLFVWILLGEPFVLLIIYWTYSYILNYSFFYRNNKIRSINELLMRYDEEIFNPYWFKWIPPTAYYFKGSRGNSNYSKLENFIFSKLISNIRWDRRSFNILYNKYTKTNPNQLYRIGEILFFKRIDSKLRWKIPLEYGIDAIIWKICNKKANS